jgi:hypothetical protein
MKTCGCLLILVWLASSAAQQNSPLKGQYPAYSAAIPTAQPSNGFQTNLSLFYEWYAQCLQAVDHVPCPPQGSTNLTAARDAYFAYYSSFPPMATGLPSLFQTREVYISIYLDRCVRFWRFVKFACLWLRHGFRIGLILSLSGRCAPCVSNHIP